MSCDCGSFKPTEALPFVPPSVPAIMAADEIVAGWDAALGVSGGATVAQWNDLGSGGFNLTQATAGFQPTFNAAGGPNGNPSVLFDGVDDFLINAALNLPAPGTTPTFYWVIVRQVTWNGPGFGTLNEANNGALAQYQGGVSPELIQYNSGDSNTTA